MSTIEAMENTARGTLCCPQCRGENLHQWKYCAQCGAALWEPCLKCGELCAAGESYCGACGVCLDDVAAEIGESIEADLLAAARLEAEYRLEEAIVLLARVGKHKHPRFLAQAAKAREMVERLGAERRRLLTAAIEARRSAQQRFNAFDYDGAAECLELVPAALLGEEGDKLQLAIAEKHLELDAALEQLHDAVRRKSLLELPPLLQRVLAVKPDHAFARHLAGQTQKRLVAVAGKMLAEHRYDQAHRLLDQIAAWADEPDFPQLRRRTAELAWLDWDLRNAPVIDDALVAAAERLRRLAPDDARAARLCDELHRRVRLAAAGRNSRALQWARPPKQTPLGLPVEWLAGFQRIICDETMDRSHLLRYPGCFAVACGLALAGVKQAALRINLLAGQQQGVLHRVKRLVRNQSAKSAWGIDLGAAGLKAVKLAWDESKQQAVVQSAVLLEHAKTLGHAANHEEEEKLIADTLKAFLDAHQIKGDFICLGLPSRKTLSRRIELPPVDAAKASKLIQFEAPRQFPIPLDQLAWDYQLLESSAEANSASKTSDENRTEALLMAARRTTTQSLVDTFQRLNVQVDLLQPDFVALHNYLVHDCLTPPGDSAAGEASSAAVAVDVGCDVTNIVVSSPRSLWFRGCGVAGNNFTRALVKDFNLTYAQAEQWKRSPQSAENLGDILESLSDGFKELLGELQRSLTAYAEAHPNRPVQRVLGLGGGFLLHGMYRCLRSGR